jgi:rubrerythrin
MIFDFNASEVFKIAIQIEENGKRFYEYSAAIIADPEVKVLFEDLARQEVEHRNKFQSLLAQLPPQASAATVWDPQNEAEQYIKMMADQHVFVSGNLDVQLAQLKNVRDALKLAVEFEKDSVLLFLSMQEATDEKKGRELIRLLVKEEQEHLRRLSLELRRLAAK